VKIPCLLIAYSRLDGIRNLLASLDEEKVSRLYLAIDGSDNQSIREIQSEIAEFVSNYAKSHHIELKIWHRDRNIGAAISIITAVDWFFSSEDFGIILEDDLIVGTDFMDFAQISFDRMVEDQDCLLFSGNQFLTKDLASDRIAWTNYSLIWGWGTTRTKWSEMKDGILFYKIDFFRGIFNPVKNYWRVGADRARLGKLDAWDIPLAHFMLLENKFCITPPVNLVTNQGNDIHALHTASDGYPLNIPTEKLTTLNFIKEERNLNKIRHYNKDLEKIIFKVKPKHSLLSIHYLFSKLFSKKTTHASRLVDRLSAIEIPK
jgi:hypothetical protein